MKRFLSLFLSFLMLLVIFPANADRKEFTTLMELYQETIQQIDDLEALKDKILDMMIENGNAATAKTLRASSGTHINLSSMSLSELASFRDQILLAMWENEEWQEVVVPKGTYEVGIDIPEGHWTITTNAISCTITVTDKLDETGKNHDWSGDLWDSTLIHAKGERFDPDSDIAEVDYVLTKGMYVIIEYGAAIFTPYTGKPDLGFK